MDKIHNVQYITHMNLEIDAICSDPMIKRFCKENNIEYSPEYLIADIFGEYFKSINTNMYTDFKKCSDKQKKLVDFKKVHQNDNIIVDYIPLSQKYIDFYSNQQVYGKIFYIDPETENLLVVRKDKDKIIIKSLTREYCSVYSDTPGYTYAIYLC